DLAVVATRQGGVTALGGTARVAAAAASAPAVPPPVEPGLASAFVAPPAPPAPETATLPKAAPAPAPPRRTAPDFSPGWEQRRGAAALATITYPWQQLGYRIE